MADEFKYDVFLSHSSKDKAAVRAIAERLRVDKLRVWFDEWELKPGDSIPAKIEEGLEHSRVLVLCMSANAFGSDWATLESQTFRFRDPLNKERRFIPLRLDEAPIKGSLAQFLYIDWLAEDREQSYAKLLEASRPPAKPKAVRKKAERRQAAEKDIQLDVKGAYIYAYALSSDGRRALTGSDDKTARLWDVETGLCLRVFEGHASAVSSVAWSADQRHALTSSRDSIVRLWDIETGRCLRALDGHTGSVWSVAWSTDQRHALYGGSHSDPTVRLWDLKTGRCLRELRGHTGRVNSVTWAADQRQALTGSDDNTVRLWDVKTGRCLRVFEGHTGRVNSVTWAANQRQALTGSDDNTVRLWDVKTGLCLRVFEGHTSRVESVTWSPDSRHVLSGGGDNEVRLWDVETGRCLCVLKGHKSTVYGVVWDPDRSQAFSGDLEGKILVWDLSEYDRETQTQDAPETAFSSLPDQVQYTNAKVLLVGESGAGKTGLSKRLALDDWQPSDSTVGAWATQWKLPVSSGNGVEREIWLWDFGGQADQRLIHQLYMDETALAVLVFDGQKEDLLETLGQWDRDLTRASRKAFAKLLVVGRVDAGGLRISRNRTEAFKNKHGYLHLLETSAKTGLGCEELKQAILSSIRWEDIPWRSSPLLFKQLKEEIVRLRDEGRVLMRFNELRETLQLRLSGEGARFTDEELKAVVNLLAGPGVVWELKFGSWVLLQPERINAYAQAVIQTMREDKLERGCLPEDRVLSGGLNYQSSIGRLETDEERFVLLAMHQTLVERSLCLREYTDQGTVLIFPSYYRRERPELVGHPAVLVSYRFKGFLDDIYATLVVRLHHTRPFEQDELWRYAADFKTLTGKKLGVKLTRRAEDEAELEVYFERAIPTEEKIIFSRYVQEHLLRKGREVVRLRHYVCEGCGTPVGNREVAMERLEAWLEGHPPETRMNIPIKNPGGGPVGPTILCVKCESRVLLWDELEKCFASQVVQAQVRQLQQESDIMLDNESKDRALVGEVISTVALAGQIVEEYSTKHYGLDMEIEFKDDDGNPTAKKLYLQLKLGETHLLKRQGDGADTFQIQHEDHAAYWMHQEYPVFLVIGDSKGEVRWMEVGDYLRRESDNGKRAVKEIVFDGERFDVMSVRRWRDRVLDKDLT